MASMAGSSTAFKSLPQAQLRTSLSTKRTKRYGVKPSVSFLTGTPTFQSTPLCLRVACAAKPETVEKVSDIVKKQLALTEGTSVTSETKFSELGADSLDTVEIVMSLEQEFGVSVAEDSAQKITTIGEAAELIEMLQN